MNKQENPNELSPPQEVDLVDLVAILWRRKSTIVIVVLISIFFASAVYVQRVSNYVVSATALIGESVRILDDGSVLSDQNMTVGESRQLLKQVLLPKEVTKLIATDTITTDSIDSSKITINTEDDEGEALNLLVISATTSPEYVDEMKAIIGGASESLVDLQNTYLDKKLILVNIKINELRKKIDLAQNPDIIANLKQGLVSKNLENHLLIDRASDIELRKQQRDLLTQKVLHAKSEFSKSQALVDVEKTKLQALTNLKPILEMRRNDLEHELASLNLSRTKLMDSHNSDKMSEFSAEALLAIDGRDGRIRSSISEIDARLLSEIPKMEATARQTISALSVNNLNLQQSILVAEQSLATLEIEQTFSLRELEEKGTAIDLQLAGFDAEQSASLMLLKQELAGLEQMLKLSLESVVIAKVGSTKEKNRVSFLMYAIVGAFAGGFFGCLLALFLELLVKAKNKALELV